MRDLQVRLTAATFTSLLLLLLLLPFLLLLFFLLICLLLLTVAWGVFPLVLSVAQNLLIALLWWIGPGAFGILALAPCIIVLLLQWFAWQGWL